ncbi:MAG: hypothetical protein ABW005_14415 [Burkholderiaceae bacterium]
MNAYHPADRLHEPAAYAKRAVAHHRPGHDTGRGCEAQDRHEQVALLREAFEKYGGFATGDHVAGLMRKASLQPISQLARWIVAREVLAVVLPSGVWLPMFQFDTRRMEPWVGVRDALCELRDVCDEWELARWFACPNPALEDRAPMELVAEDPATVTRAARSYRLALRALSASVKPG